MIGNGIWEREYTNCEEFMDAIRMGAWRELEEDLWLQSGGKGSVEGKEWYEGAVVRF
jgi:hypothetical protein